MQTPFELLEVPDEADDAAIKKAYLRKVRENPPERDGVAFQTIRTAYETIQTRPDRIRYALFNRQSPELSSLTAQALKPGSVQRPEAKTITAVLAESALATLLHTLK
ncbi:MAG: hypothetical protein RLZZ226_2107 [Pseudomonadota bacterium]|jgi:curved DNA-binding protein CbpA